MGFLLLVPLAFCDLFAAQDSVLAVATPSLPVGQELEAYQAPLNAAGGSPPYAWSVLPPVMAWGRGDDGLTSAPAAAEGVTAVSAGLDHALALLGNGTVIAWGRLPAPPSLRRVVAIASGSEHDLALLDDGSIAAWGNNLHHQIDVPANLGPVMAVSAGVNHSLVLLTNGTVRAWGDGDYGQLDVPDGLSNVTAIAAGGYHNLALKDDGTVVAWGYDDAGQATVPAGLSGVSSISAGCMHSLALRFDGTVAAWGDNSWGQRSPPPSLADVTAIAAGGYHSLALRSDGSVAAWGNNGFGQTNVPAVLDRVAAIACGMYVSLALPDSRSRLPEGLSCGTDGWIAGVPLAAGSNAVRVAVRDSGGTLACKSLALMVASNVNARPVIVSFSPPSGRIVMAEGSGTVFSVQAVDPEGAALSWRWTLDGLAAGTDTNAFRYDAGWGSAGPHTVSASVSDGAWTNGATVAWDVTVTADLDGDGLDDRWEILHFGDCSYNGNDDPDGDGFPNLEEFRNGTDPAARPVEWLTAELPGGMEMAPYAVQLFATNGGIPLAWRVVAVPAVIGWGADDRGQATPPADLDEVLAVAAGADHSLAVRPDGTVAAWGDNRSGQCAVPSNLMAVAAVAGGLNHSLALRSNGTVAAWGSGSAATAPGGLVNVRAIAAGWTHSVVLFRNGTVGAWGSNADGEAGVPAGLDNVAAISAGAHHTLALLSNGTVAAWGSDLAGQVAVPAGLSNVTAISAGAYHSLALRSDGTVAAWGLNDSGQTTVPAILTNGVSVAAGGFHNLALLGGGGASAWGESRDSQLAIPAEAGNAAALSAGLFHSLARRPFPMRLPAGLTLSPDGCLSGVPLQAGTGEIVVAVSGGGTEARRLFRISIASNPNLRPVIDGVSPGLGAVTVARDASRLFTVQAHDPEGAPLHYAWEWDGTNAGGDSPSYTLAAESATLGGHALAVTLSDGLWTNAVQARWTVAVIDIAQTNIWLGGASADWFEPANWSLNMVPEDGMDVRVPAGAPNSPALSNASADLASFVLSSNQTLTVRGWTSALTARDMTLNGTVTHAANTLASTNASGEWIPLHRVWLVGSNITLGAGGKIDVSNRGYSNVSGPGGAMITGYGSPGHGGPGRRGRGGGVAGVAYGDPAAPVQPGSGGGLHVNSGWGGGAVRIEAQGVLAVEGTIAANGQNALGTHGSGGSGGSIWASCRTLEGRTNGLMTVNGGTGNYYGAGAAGGRISVCYDTHAQSQLPVPCPPIRFSGKPGGRGPNPNSEMLPPGMATLYFPDTGLLSPPFEARRFQYTKLAIPGFTNWAPDSLTLDECVIGLPDGFRLTVAGDMVLTNGAGLHVFAAPTGDPAVTEGALVAAGVNLIIASNAWICPYADPTNGAIVKIMAGANLEVSAGGGIDADDKGYTFCCGPGSPTNTRGGGGYGGTGGQGYDGMRGGMAYGSDAGSVQAGSGGGQSPAVAGQGGGAIRLVVGNRADIKGTLTAAGAPGIADHGPGGSGGGIGLSCHTFDGRETGLFRVDGGAGHYYGGSGSGGRIVVQYNSAAQREEADPRPPVRFSAFAVTDPYPNPAEPGSLYFPDTIPLMASPTSPAAWTGQRFWHVRLAVPSFTNWAPAYFLLDNCAIRFPDGFRLDVAGDVALGSGSVIRLHAVSAGSDPYGARLTAGGRLEIGTNAWIQPVAHPASGALVRLRVEGDVRIDAGGGIDADARGYGPVLGNTVGPGPGRDAGSGGGYGGKGGGALGGVTNGCALMPLGPGSPGGWRVRGDGSTSANGGGGIHLFVNGRLKLDGTLTAAGGNGGYYRGAGGSGGGILVSARGVSGSGLLRANGGTCNAGSGSGGGGRIAVWDHLGADEAEHLAAMRSPSRLFLLPAHDAFTGSVQVTGGPVTNAGENGTAGFYRMAPPFQTVIVIY